MRIHWYAVLCVTVAGCGSDFGGAKCTSTISASTDAEANRVAIQTAIESSTKGGVICLSGGTYPLLGEIDVAAIAGLELRGPSSGTPAVLDFKGQKSGAIGVSANNADGFAIRNLTVQNTPGDAIKVQGTKGVSFTGVTVRWDTAESTKNGAYGLYPVLCSNVLIDHCTVNGASDAGIYVGQSRNVLVQNSEAFGNVAGIEMENTVDGEVLGNYAHDNTAGLLIFALPNLNVLDSGRVKVHKNRSIHNNGKNFADPAGIVAAVPTGTGVLVMASPGNEVHDNDVSGNDSVGIAVVSYLILSKKYTDAKYNPYPEGNWVHDNRLSQNGADPSDLAYMLSVALATSLGKQLLPIPDLVWDGLVDSTRMPMGNTLTNCFQNNGTATFIDLGIIDETHFKPSTDLAPFNCAQTVLPAIMP